MRTKIVGKIQPSLFSPARPRKQTRNNLILLGRPKSLHKYTLLEVFFCYYCLAGDLVVSKIFFWDKPVGSELRGGGATQVKKWMIKVDLFQRKRGKNTSMGSQARRMSQACFMTVINRMSIIFLNLLLPQPR